MSMVPQGQLMDSTCRDQLADGEETRDECANTIATASGTS